MTILGEDNDIHPGGKIHILDYQSKKHKRVTRSTYGAELHGLADSMEQARIISCALTELYQGSKTHYELDQLEQAGNYHFPLDAVIDAKSVFDSIVAADLKTPAEQSLIHVLGQLREHMMSKRIRLLWWVDTRDMLADGLYKGAVKRHAIVKAMIKALWEVLHPTAKDNLNV